MAGDCACSLMTSHDGFGGPYYRERAIDYDINLIQAELKLHLSAAIGLGEILMDYMDLLQNVSYYWLCNFDIVLLQGTVCKYFSCCLWIPLSVITKCPASLLGQL